MERDILIHRKEYRKVGGLGTTLCSQQLLCSMKSFERDIDSATGSLDLRNALALGRLHLARVPHYPCEVPRALPGICCQYDIEIA